MRRRILSIGQTDVYLHLATLLFMLYALLSGIGPMLLTGMLSILLHEAAHALMAALCGEPPLEIELTPLGAVLRLEDEERLPSFRRLLMLAAGPAMTLLLCCFALWLTKAQVLSVQMGRGLFMANLSILMMNLLPALPLDGGRMLALGLGCFCRGEVVRRVMRVSGMVLGCAAIGGSIWLAWRFGGWNMSLAAAGCFLMYSASQATTAQALAELRMLMDRKIHLERRGYIKYQYAAVLAHVSLRHAVRLMAPQRMTELHVLQAGTLAHIGILTESELISAYMDRPEMSCGDACHARNDKNTAKSDKKP